MCEKKPYYITTAIAYTSRKPHIGNSYEIVLTDAIARYKRMRGYDVFFQTGTDEHGQKIEMYAQAEGCTPKEYVDKVHDRTPYVRRLSRICASPILFRGYQLYRRLTGKTRTPLQMYFGQ